MSNTQPTLETVDRERSIAMRIILSAPVVALFAIWSMQSVRATLRDYVEVSGFVTLNGDPLPRAIVTLHPCDTRAASGNLPTGNATAMGEFSLRIPMAPNTDARQGYIATVVCKPLVIEGEAIIPAIDAVPALVVVDRLGVVRRSFIGPVSATHLWAALAEVRGDTVPPGCAD